MCKQAGTPTNKGVSVSLQKCVRRERCLQVVQSVCMCKDVCLEGRCEEPLWMWKPPRLCVGSTRAACVGRGIWGREMRLVYVGALCQST